MTDPTTPAPLTDIDAIQQRTDAYGRTGPYGYVINDIEHQGNWVHDIHLLLAEVDRLRAELRNDREQLNGAFGEITGLRTKAKQAWSEGHAAAMAAMLDERDSLAAQLAATAAERNEFARAAADAASHEPATATGAPGPDPE